MIGDVGYFVGVPTGLVLNDGDAAVKAIAKHVGGRQRTRSLC